MLKKAISNTKKTLYIYEDKGTMLNLGKELIKALKVSAVAAPVTVVAICAAKELPELLASKDTELGDTFVSENKKGETKTYNRRKARNAVLKENGVSRWSSFWFRAKEFFGFDQDLISELEEEYNLSAETDIETFKECARDYFRSQIGDIEDKTPEEIEKIYEKLKKDYILQITSAKSKDNEMFNEVIASVIGELRAEDRGAMADATMRMASSKADEISKANSLLNNSEYNLLNEDAFGNIPDIDEAIEYHKAYYGGLDEEGVSRALAETETKIDELDIEECKRLQQLRDSGVVLTKEQKSMLARYENLCVAGPSGAMLALPLNSNIGTGFLNTSLGYLNNMLKEKGLQYEVLRHVLAYEEAHPEINDIIKKLHGSDLKEILDRASGGAYSRFSIQYKEELHTGMLSKPDKKTSSTTLDDKAQDAYKANTGETHQANSSISTEEINGAQNTNTWTTVKGQAAVSVPVAGSKPSDKEGKNVKSVQCKAEAEKSASSLKTRPAIITSYQECKEYIENNSEAAEDIITGKIKLSSASAQYLVINEYKMMHNADQGRVLGSASDKWYNLLKDKTRNKSAAIETFLASGNKGKSYERTKDMQETLKEERERVA